MDVVLLKCTLTELPFFRPNIGFYSIDESQYLRGCRLKGLYQPVSCLTAISSRHTHCGIPGAKGLKVARWQLLSG